MSASLFVATEEPVNRLPADLESSLEGEPATDLIGAEAFGEEPNDQGPVGSLSAVAAR